MKHIKKFETNKYGFTDEDDKLNFVYTEGDYVFLLYCSHDDVTIGFNVNTMYQIVTLDKNDYNYPYEIENEFGDTIWVKEEQLRPAYKYEINAKKYNL